MSIVKIARTAREAVQNFKVNEKKEINLMQKPEAEVGNLYRVLGCNRVRVTG